MRIFYYRDAKYIYPKHKTVNGKKDFWARGDAWVLAGLAKVLERTCRKNTSIISSLWINFKKMAKAVAAIQQPEGYWTHQHDGSGILHRDRKPVERHCLHTDFMGYKQWVFGKRYIYASGAEGMELFVKKRFRKMER